MDAAKKKAQNAKFQQLAALALLGVFGLVLQHSLKQMRSKGKPVTPPAQAEVVEEAAPAAARAVQSLQGRQAAIQRLEQEGGGQPGPAAGAAPGVAVNKELRDPLISLLPSQKQFQQQRQRTQADAKAAASAAKPQPSAGGGSAPSVTVQGLIFNGAFPQAIIDGSVYKVGEMVLGAKIIGITRDGVMFDVQGTVFVVSPMGRTTPALSGTGR